MSLSGVNQNPNPSNIVVHKEVELIPVSDIRLNNWNPNFVTNDIQRAITDDIKKNGFIGTIVIQKHNTKLDQDNVIINGEHRYQAFKELKVDDKIPCTVLDIDDDKAKVLTIRLNREHGELLPNKIGEILRALSPEEDLAKLKDLTMMDEEDLRVMMDLRVSDLDSVLKSKKEQEKKMVKIDANKMVECPKCSHSFEVYYS
jgi:ParB-like chromosome segregation protein Spo0J